MTTNKLLLSVAGFAALSAVAISSVIAADAGKGKAANAGSEKCYGVVKAGANDCASASKSHSCAGHAADDNMGDDWIMLPKGLCARLANGSTEPQVEEQHDEDL